MASKKPLAAIRGFAMSDLSRQYIGPGWQLAVTAIHRAIADAGLKKSDIDGLLINKSPVATLMDLPMDLLDYAGLKDLTLCSVVEAEGSSGVQMVQQAALAVQAGMAKAVVCVFADAPIVPGVSTQQAFGMPLPLMGKLGSEAPTGLFGPVAAYALAARRYMHKNKLTEDHLGAVAVACRQWALKNPLAMMKKQLSMEDHHNSPYVVEPFHLFDCSFPVNGAVAVVVTSAQRAADGPQPAVYIHGMGQGHRGVTNRRGFENEIEIGAKLAGQGAYAMAGVGPKDIDCAQVYDAFTYCILLQLEQYGFVEPGGGGAFALAGQTAPGGSFPVNTGGGQLSGYYLQGGTPLSEGVMQTRGTAGERQVKHDLVLTAAYGGRMMYHACMITSPHASL